MKLRLITTFVLLIVTSESSFAVDSKVSVTEVLFEESEPGIANYQTRLLFWEDKIRIDDAQDNDDFLIFDLSEDTIFNIDHEERRILKIVPFDKIPETLEFKIDIELRSQLLEGAPDIDGQVPVHKEYLVDSKLCQTLVVLPEVLGDLVRAMSRFHFVLASNNYRRLEDVPKEIKTPCYLSKFVLQPARGWQFGLPLQYADDSGYRKRLVKFGTIEKPATLFSLPDGYKTYSPL